MRREVERFLWMVALAIVVGLAIYFAIPGAQTALRVATPGTPHAGKPKVVTRYEAIPAPAIGTSPETSRIPEGATPGAARLRSTFSNTAVAPSGEAAVGPVYLAEASILLVSFGSSIHLDSHGAQLIEQFEEVRKSTYCPYWDAYGRVWTRGFGETDWGGSFGGVCISLSTAERNLVSFVESKYQYAVRSLGMNLNQCQIDGLDSLVWNLGPGVLLPGGALRGAIQGHNFAAILGYDHAGGVVLAGLARRRQVEYHWMTMSCSYGESAAQRAARVRSERVAKLHRDYAYRRNLNRAIAGQRCLNPKGYRGYSGAHVHFCLTERRRHGVVSRDIKHLRALGAR